MYTAKAVEYLIAVAFLFLFIPFWRFVNAEGVGEPAVAAEGAGLLDQLVDWFLVPRQVYFHPGHAWARVGDGDVVTVGMDDFAQKLVGKASEIRLPEVGEKLGQGEKAWSLASDSKSVDMLSPVDGTVVAVNDEVLSSPEALNAQARAEPQAPPVGKPCTTLDGGGLGESSRKDDSRPRPRLPGRRGAHGGDGPVSGSR
jgi:glycine cleavage system H lipoate-binding protein